MADLMKMIGITQPSEVSGTRSKAESSGDRSRADGRGGEESSRQRAALDRLATFLASGTPPRQDVPRGYYLNIRV